MTDVFISYSRKDKEFVQALSSNLEKIDRDAWVDWEDIDFTADWWQEIEGGIERAQTFIFVVSPNSVSSSPVCRQEIDYAVKLNKRLVPIVRDDSFDKTQLHPALSKLNWLFFRKLDNFEEAFLSLIKALDTDFEHVRTHTRLLLWAIEWDKKGRSDDLTLRGRDFEDATDWLDKSLKENKDPSPAGVISDYVEASRTNYDRLKKVEQYNSLRNETLMRYVRHYLEQRKKSLEEGLAELRKTISEDTFLRTSSNEELAEQELSIVKNLLGEEAQWHPQEAIMVANAGAQYDYVDVYRFQCCGAYVNADLPPSQFRADGCERAPSASL